MSDFWAPIYLTYITGLQIVNNSYLAIFHNKKYISKCYFSSIMIVQIYLFCIKCVYVGGRGWFPK